jgi:hypothetical protein
MKTNTILGSLTLLLVFCYVLVYQIDLDTHGAIARFIPSDALCFIEQYNGMKVARKWSRSPLAKHLGSIDFHRLAHDLNLDDAYAETIDDFKKSFKQITESKLANSLLAKHLGMALLTPLDRLRAEDKIEDVLADNLLFICEPQYSSTVLSIIGETYVSQDKHYKLTTTQYGNHAIKRISLGKRRLSLVSIDGYFLIAPNERQLRKAIDAFDGDLQPLHNFPPFRKCVKRLRGAQRIFYCNIEQARAAVEEIIAVNHYPLRKLLQKELATLTGFDGIAYGNWPLSKDIFAEKVITHFDQQRISPLVEKYLLTKPEKSKLYSYATKDPMFYYWSNTINLKHLLPYLQGEGKSREQFRSIEQQIKSNCGKSIEEIIAMLGSQASLHIARGSPGSSLRVPRAMLFFESPNAAELKTIAAKLCNAFRIGLTDKEYRQVHYKYWSLAPEDGLKPIFGTWNNLFFLGNSSVLLEDMVDYHQAGNALSVDAAYKKIDPGITAKNNSITYLHNTELLELAKQVVQMLSTIVAIEDKTTATRAKIIVNELIIPLLEGAKMYERSMNRSYFTTETVVIESRTKISTPKEGSTAISWKR